VSARAELPARRRASLSVTDQPWICWTPEAVAASGRPV
jgi:hypothetical protein